MLVAEGSSPRMRGTPYSTTWTYTPPGIIPAHAGNTCRGLGSGWRKGDHPRACGEHYLRTLISSTSTGSSPRMRGTRRSPDIRVLPTRIIPAHAGNTIETVELWKYARDHPRACGEHEVCHLVAPISRGSSPRMRGTPFVIMSKTGVLGIIPAHAGNTRHGRGYCRLWGDHPRACGEHDLMVIQALEPLGSSPRMRGTPNDVATDKVIAGIIPAHAGNTIRPNQSQWCCRDHPRACGEHHDIPARRHRLQGSSPRMRGTLPLHHAESDRIGIIPAHAGNTGRHSCRSIARRDHPRACGEHWTERNS